MGAFEILTGAATVVGSFVKLADTPAAKRIWEGIKSFFKGTGASPPENNPGDMISVDVLKTILSLVREDKLQELVREAESDKSGGTVRNFTVSATSGGVVSQGDNATIYYSSSPPPPPPPDHYADATRLFKLRQYDQASTSFNEAIAKSPENSEVYFYAAACLLKGKPAFVALRSEINKIENHINTALAIERKGIYYYFWAYIKFDYYFRKPYATSPSYTELLNKAKACGVSASEIQRLYDDLGVSCPKELMIDKYKP